jgi:CRISPR-associated protein Csd1
MILQRLYELALRENLVADPAFEDQAVPYVIKLGQGGEFLGIEERRGKVLVPSKKKDAPPREREDKGRVLSVPRPHGNTASQGFARYFADTLPRVLPLTGDEKSARSRATFWQQLDRAADETDDPALRAVQAFGRALRSDPETPVRVRAEVGRLDAPPGDRCTFAWNPDLGKTILEREKVREWYRGLFRSYTAGRQEGGPCGVCQVTRTVGPIPTTHPIKLAGVPGGLPVGVSLVSYDKAAFESYGLVGAANASVGYEATEGYSRALTALIQQKLPGSPPTRLRVGNTLFLFWTRQPADTGWMGQFDAPDTAQVERLFRAAESGKAEQSAVEENQFYLLGLSGNSARAIVRDYLELPLPRAQANLGRWFRDLRIASATREGVGQPTCLFPLWQLVLATAFDKDQVSPDVPDRLLHAALRGDPLPDSVLAACLGRLRAEGSGGFRPPRLALVKLTLLRRNVPVSETLNPDETDPAYVYGRLLCLFEQIQYAALGDVNANVVDKYYGTFSAAPALVFARLYANAQNHLRKLRGDKPGVYVALDRQLSEVTALLPASPPRGQLSLQNQGRFALGYYHQKAKRFEEAAERKLRAAQKSEAATTESSVS